MQVSLVVQWRASALLCIPNPHSSKDLLTTLPFELGAMHENENWGAGNFCVNVERIVSC